MRRHLGLATALAASLWATATVADPTTIAPTAIEGATGRPLTVEIRWETKADLDLFLTGPDGETVYFGNRQARNGIRMGVETGCREMDKAAPPYFETVAVPAAEVGRYRISVDFIRDCDTRTTQVPFTMHLIDTAGRELGRADAKVSYRVLQTVGWEFDLK